MNKAYELEKIRETLESIALIRPGISMSLRNDTTGNVLLQTRKCADTVAVFAQLYGPGKADMLSVVNEQGGVYKLSGYFGRDGHSRKTLQFVYVNHRLVKKTRIHKLLNQSLANLPSLKPKMRQVSPSLVTSNQYIFKSPPKFSDVFPVYVLQIVCPLSEYDITFEPAKTMVEFKHWDPLLAIVDSMTKKFVEEQNKVFLGTVDDKNPPIESETSCNKEAKVKEADHTNVIAAENLTDVLKSKTAKRAKVVASLDESVKELTTPTNEHVMVCSDAVGLGQRNVGASSYTEDTMEPGHADSDEELERGPDEMNGASKTVCGNAEVCACVKLKHLQDKSRTESEFMNDDVCSEQRTLGSLTRYKQSIGKFPRKTSSTVSIDERLRQLKKILPQASKRNMYSSLQKFRRKVETKQSIQADDVEENGDDNNCSSGLRTQSRQNTFNLQAVCEPNYSFRSCLGRNTNQVRVEGEDDQRSQLKDNISSNYDNITAESIKDTNPARISDNSTLVAFTEHHSEGSLTNKQEGGLNDTPELTAHKLLELNSQNSNLFSAANVATTSTTEMLSHGLAHKKNCDLYSDNREQVDSSNNEILLTNGSRKRTLQGYISHCLSNERRKIVRRSAESDGEKVTSRVTGDNNHSLCNTDEKNCDMSEDAGTVAESCDTEDCDIVHCGLHSDNTQTVHVNAVEETIVMDVENSVPASKLSGTGQYNCSSGQLKEETSDGRTEDQKEDNHNDNVDDADKITNVEADSVLTTEYITQPFSPQGNDPGSELVALTFGIQETGSSGTPTQDVHKELAKTPESVGFTPNLSMVESAERTPDSVLEQFASPDVVQLRKNCTSGKAEEFIDTIEETIPEADVEQQNDKRNSDEKFTSLDQSGTKIPSVETVCDIESNRGSMRGNRNNSINTVVATQIHTQSASMESVRNIDSNQYADNRNASEKGNCSNLNLTLSLAVDSVTLSQLMKLVSQKSDDLCTKEFEDKHESSKVVTESRPETTQQNVGFSFADLFEQTPVSERDTGSISCTVSDTVNQEANYQLPSSMFSEAEWEQDSGNLEAFDAEVQPAENDRTEDDSFSCQNSETVRNDADSCIEDENVGKGFHRVSFEPEDCVQPGPSKATVRQDTDITCDEGAELQWNEEDGVDEDGPAVEDNIKWRVPGKCLCVFSEDYLVMEL